MVTYKHVNHTQLYVATVSPARDVEADYIAYGHSLCVDPWGCLVAEADEKETIVYAELGKSNACIKRALIYEY